MRRKSASQLNGFRRGTLQQMVHVCYNGMSENESQNMLDNVVAMTDLSEDEGSPRHGMTGDNAQTEIFQAYQAYQVGLDLIQVKLQRVQEENSSGSENLPDQLGATSTFHWGRRQIQNFGWRSTMEEVRMQWMTTKTVREMQAVEEVVENCSELT